MSYIGYDPSAPGTISIQRYTAGTDFTAGSTTALTITYNPGSANNVSIFFDGIAQHHDQWSLSGTTITFNSAIPTGTLVVEIVYGKSVAINEPADGSVTAAKLESVFAATLATLTGAQTLTNKTLSDSTTYLADNSDSTKKAQFELSGVTTATTRTMTVPNASGTIAYGPGASGSGNIVSDGSGASTLSVAGLVPYPVGLLINTNNGSWSVTNLTGGVEGQVVILLNSGSGTLTFTRNNAYLDGSVDQALGQHDAIVLVLVGALWRQIGKLCVNG